MSCVTHLRLIGCFQTATLNPFLLWEEMFLARSEMSVKTIGHRRHRKQLCGGMEIEFSCTNKCNWNTWKNYSGFRTWRCKQTAPIYRSHHFNWKQWSTTGFIWRFSVNLWPLQAGLLLLKAMVLSISRTYYFWPKISEKRCGL